MNLFNSFWIFSGFQNSPKQTKKKFKVKNINFTAVGAFLTLPHPLRFYKLVLHGVEVWLEADDEHGRVFAGIFLLVQPQPHFIDEAAE